MTIDCCSCCRDPEVFNDVTHNSPFGELFTPAFIQIKDDVEVDEGQENRVPLLEAWASAYGALDGPPNPRMITVPRINHRILESAGMKWNGSEWLLNGRRISFMGSAADPTYGGVVIEHGKATPLISIPC